MNKIEKMRPLIASKATMCCITMVVVLALAVENVGAANKARTLFDPEDPKDGEEPQMSAEERVQKLREYRIKERERRQKLPRPPPREFNSPRLENIWKAAKDRYDNVTEADTLKKIKNDLNDIVKLEKTVRKDEELDENSEKLKTLREKLKTFFDKYEKLQPPPLQLTPHNDSVLEDPTLKEYWSRVKHLDFLEENDIRELQGEFMYCEDQIKALNHFLDNDPAFKKFHEVGHDEITKVLKKGENETEKFMEAIYAQHGVNETRKAFLIWLQLGKEVANCYDRLHHYTEEEIRKEGFKEPLVNKLWIEAQKSNMTKLEMQKFKSELDAFQNKLKKKENLVRHASEVERRYTHRIKNDDQLPHPVKVDMATQVKKMREEHKSRREELSEWYKKLTSKLFSTIPDHLPDEL